MKLKQLLDFIDIVRKKHNISECFIVGGSCRDKLLGTIKNQLSDIDLTTGNSQIFNLASEITYELNKKYNITVKKSDDGHTSIFLGKLKIDTSSNFIVPNINKILIQKGIQKPTDLQREMFSRDFNCNALLMKFDLKTISDPTGQGFKDIEQKILRTCLDPSVTFPYNTNRIIRVIYLAAKLGFSVDQNIIDWVSKNRDFIRMIDQSFITKNINKALDKDADRAIWLINKMDLWNYLPISEKLYPYYKNQLGKTAQIKKNLDIGEGFYANMDKYDSVLDFRRNKMKKRKKVLDKLKGKK